MEGSSLAALAVHQRYNGPLLARLPLEELAAPRCMRRYFVGIAKVGFVRLDNLALASKRRRIDILHRLSDAVREKPGRAIRDAQLAVQLVRANPFLARGHQMEGERPLVQRDMAALHDRFHGHAERLAAGVALIHALAMGLAIDQRSFVHDATM